MAGERRARAARRGPPRGREPPLGRAGWSNKTKAITCCMAYPLWSEFSRVKVPAGGIPAKTNAITNAITC